ncbi:hypothetical protein B0T22DRAFT_249167 [Podospora appendiculata]|uniref:Uncharacterized protein n=1 Tax=Podospora appendiculata TaxID=314037 RepID=A0AAE0X2I8_9PEZI|nr:hypothetical protein B0T22DRAFT_249167 [Podospora appendiculata]
MEGLDGRVYAMGSRIQVEKRDPMNRFRIGTLASALDQIPTPTLVARAEETCASANLCEKPGNSSSLTIPIAVGLGLPVFAALCVLVFLHRRNMKRQQREDAVDPHKSLDFGLGEHPGSATKSKRKSFLGVGGKEKEPQSRFNRQQMSMDMNISSPYLLPPDAAGSKESLHSLARTLQSTEDPYRPVQFAASDAGSIRSFNRGPDGGSVYTRSSSRQESSRRQSRPMASPGPYSPPPRQTSFARSGVLHPEPSHMKPHSVPEEAVLRSPPAAKVSPAVQDDPSISIMPHDDGEVYIQEPLAVAQKVGRQPLASPIQDSPADSGVDMGYAESALGKHQAQDVAHVPEQFPTGLGLVNHPEPMQASIHMATPTHEQMPASPPLQHSQASHVDTLEIEEPLEYYDYPDPEPPIPQQNYGHHDEYEERGRNMQRQSRGLGVPHQDNRRLSVGFRPLPPSEVTESEDPEYRANRIRSFYKEYFDDGKGGEAAPPVPRLPPQHQKAGGYQNGGGNQNAGGYYEDYDENYMGEAAYFDPDANAFVMPYAQPVSRRAMTPPPTGQRFRGNAPPRAFNGGSLAGMNMPQGYGPPRPDSSVSNLRGPQRPGSSASGAWNRPRAGSAAAGARSQAPRKPMPAPVALNTLPNPSKLRDDSFAIMGSIDFAPPETFADRTRGRSQSPAGERRPYKMGIPAHSPLVNAFEELAALPSPHSLRKSSTFTGLDFAPPRKFGNDDSRSETGSIRSNRSGISAVQLGAIRNGAGRVSRLPGDQVFTAVEMQNQLKPNWGMRN